MISLIFFLENTNASYLPNPLLAPVIITTEPSKLNKKNLTFYRTWHSLFPLLNQA